MTSAADTSKLFVEALSSSRIEDAQACISKGSARYFDLTELSDYFRQNYNYKRLQKSKLGKRQGNCVTDLLLVQEQSSSSIIHLHMVKELGAWKIYDIDKE
ncbi:MAG: hypothetical protein FWE68_03010 [Defluviitaleaceae bacterium]|nr:hypothetical protein [Defluviitaleaceae bacterium]